MPTVNEATTVDLKVIYELSALGWKVGDTLLYQQEYQLTPEQKAEFPGINSIKPDIVLQDLNNDIIAVIENKLEDEKKALQKLRILYAAILKPRFLYACSKERNLFLDTNWKGEDAEFKQVNSFMSLEEMKLKIQQLNKILESTPIQIDKTIAGGYDPAAGNDRYFQTECIGKLLTNYQAGKQKMLVHMATGLGKTRTMVALSKALLSSGLSKRILFVVDRVLLAKQAIDDGFSLISKEYPSTRIRTSNFRQQKHANIHVVVIDTLELIYNDIPSNFYDLLIVDECHRSITVNRKLIFDHFLCPRIGLTATPKIAIAKEGADVSEDDLAILDTYKLFGCENNDPDYKFDLQRGIDEDFLAPYRIKESTTYLTEIAKDKGVEFDYVLDPDERNKIMLGKKMNLKLEQLERKYISQERCNRIAEELKEYVQYGEKVIVFGVSQAHCNMLAKSINSVFHDIGESPRYCEPIISDNSELNETLKSWFKKPYRNPYVVTSVDIMSTGVDIPCTRYIVFAALTKSVGKYIQMLGRGTRLDPKTGKVSFTIIDYVQLCKRMNDNGKGSPKSNEHFVGQDHDGGGGKHPKGEYFLIDNPDPANLITRYIWVGDSYKVKDNISVDEAKKIFEESLRKTSDRNIIDLKEKAQLSDYEPSDQELELLKEWLKAPEVFLDEGQLQRIYNFPDGTVWDFIRDAVGSKRVPTQVERIINGYESFLREKNFSDEQIIFLKKVRDSFIINLTKNERFTFQQLFSNPIYQNLIGSYFDVDKMFEGKLDEVSNELVGNFKIK
jgi:type I site-specific restriction endonuclease